jgi:hypothetical protein
MIDQSFDCILLPLLRSKIMKEIGIPVSLLKPVCPGSLKPMYFLLLQHQLEADHDLFL